MSATIKPHWADNAAMPVMGEGPDGRFTRIDEDPRLLALFKEWQADACAHARQATIERYDAVGRKFFTVACQDCGSTAAGHLAHSKVDTVSDLTWGDIEEVSERYGAERRDRLEQIAKAAAERMQPVNRQSYDDYLRSPDWKRRVAKIMQRSNGICEGCLTNPAEEVHHLTYEHVGAEFAWELRAVCGACHRRVHGRSAN